MLDGLARQQAQHPIEQPIDGALYVAGQCLPERLRPTRAWQGVWTVVPLGASSRASKRSGLPSWSEPPAGPRRQSRGHV